MTEESLEEAFKRFGDLQPGDLIVGPDGAPVEVAKVYEEHIPETMYRLEFEGGETIEASGNHLWYVESSLDRSLISKRLKEGKRLLRDLPPETLEELERIATLEDFAETALIDVVTLLGAEENRPLQELLARVAMSLGHVGEEETAYEDLYSGEVFESSALRTYDARRFCQQLLALTSWRARKKWPLVVGQVMTTEDLLFMDLSSLDFPVVKPLKPKGKWW